MKRFVKKPFVLISCILILIFLIPVSAFATQYVITTNGQPYLHDSNAVNGQPPDQLLKLTNISDGSNDFIYQGTVDNKYYTVNPELNNQVTYVNDPNNPVGNPTLGQAVNNTNYAGGTGECWVGFTNGGIDLGNCIAQGGYWVLFTLSKLLTLIGTLLGLILNVTLVNMSKTISGITAIDTGWKVFRDVSNMIFIFVILYIAISTILRIDQAKNLLVRLIIVALLINFSLFFTKVVIDSSNILAIQFCNQIQVCGGSSLGLGDAFMAPFQLQTINSPSGQINLQATQATNEQRQAFAKAPNAILLAVMGSLFILIAIFVFIAVSILFLMRFVLLVVLMILSPLAFVSMVLPKMSGQATRWWKTLFSESFFAPFFMAMIWVVLLISNQLKYVVASVSGGQTTGSLAGAITNPSQTSAVGIVLNFSILSGFLIASIIISKQMGVYGGATAEKVFNGLRTRAQGVVGRNTLGKPANWINDRLKKTTFGNTRVGDSIRRMTAGGLATAKFQSKTSGEDAAKQKEKIHSARTEFEAKQADKRARDRINPDKKDNDVAEDKNVQDKTQFRDRRAQELEAAKDALDKAGKSANQAQIKTARDNMTAAAQAREEAQRDLDAAKEGVIKRVKLEEQAAQATKLEAGFRYGSRGAAAKELRKATKDKKIWLEESKKKQAEEGWNKIVERIIKDQSSGGKPSKPPTSSPPSPGPKPTP